MKSDGSTLKNRNPEAKRLECTIKNTSNEENEISITSLKAQLEHERQDLVNEVLESINNRFCSLTDHLSSNNNNFSNSRRSSKTSQKSNNPLPEKIFKARQSVLTELLINPHIQTLYHMFVAALIVFTLNTFVTDLVNKGGIIHTYHAEWLFWAFGKTSDVIRIWLGMQSVILMVYPVFRTWASIIHDNNGKILSNRIVNLIALLLYILFQIMLFILPLKFILSHELPPCSTAIVILENVRFLMKTHAFIRHNSQLILNSKSKTADDKMTFDQYLYFLFAPTLVYRSSYPRTNKIHWQYVVTNFAQVLFCVLYMYYILVRFCGQYFENFNSQHVSLEKIICSIFGCMIPGTLVLLICFFCFLHSWLNAFAEMLRFADRLFYKDWWNSTTFSNYYRTWNVLVHDWLYAYIYRDIVINSPWKNPELAKTLVFLISALVHEYILIVIFRFFFPVLFVLFGGAGFAFMFLKGRSRMWNVGFWVAMFLGTGVILCLYSREWYARVNCQPYYDNYADYLIPRSLFCA